MGTPAPESVKRLVDRFDQNRDAYLSGSYNEMASSDASDSSDLSFLSLWSLSSLRSLLRSASRA